MEEINGIIVNGRLHKLVKDKNISYVCNKCSLYYKCEDTLCMQIQKNMQYR